MVDPEESQIEARIDYCVPGILESYGVSGCQGFAMLPYATCNSLSSEEGARTYKSFGYFGQLRSVAEGQKATSRLLDPGESIQNVPAFAHYHCLRC